MPLSDLRILILFIYFTSSTSVYCTYASVWLENINTFYLFYLFNIFLLHICLCLTWEYYFIFILPLQHLSTAHIPLSDLRILILFIYFTSSTSVYCTYASVWLENINTFYLFYLFNICLLHICLCLTSYFYFTNSLFAYWEYTSAWLAAGAQCCCVHGECDGELWHVYKASPPDPHRLPVPLLPQLPHSQSPRPPGARILLQPHGEYRVIVIVLLLLLWQM